jgi:DNA-binding NarL/FixJ family response regulator
VDDDPGFLSLTAQILEGLGVDVLTTAADAASAIVSAEAGQPDAVLVDVGLPDRDGVDLGQQLAALPWRPRVVLISSDRDAVTAIDAGRGGRALSFIPKEDLAGDSLRRLLTCE